MTKEFEKRIKEFPSYLSWNDGIYIDSISNDGVIDYAGLSDQEKILLYVYAWNKSEICPFKRSVMQKFKWSSYKVSKLFRELKGKGLIYCVPTFSEDSGLLNGTGYMINRLT